MADYAVGGLGEILAAPDDVGVGKLARNAGRICFVIVRERDCRATGKRKRPGKERKPSEDTAGDDDDTGENDNRGATHGGHAFTAIAARSIGRRRNGTPVAAKIALRRAGGPAVEPVSPMPPGRSPLLMMWTSIGGVSSMRSIR